MGKIRILDEKTASKIAAGEIIERPASVVKELLENSIDAKAKNIEIYLEKGGKKKILVRDDGEGMDKEDLKLCFKPHATSKIKTLEDLNRLSSLGFRGEALHSIASVSRLTIKSRKEGEEAAYQVEVIAGKLKSIFPTGANKGTEIKVENLFFNLPARKKFLKSDSTELKHILQVIEHIALSNQKLNLKVFHNQRLILNLKASDLKTRIKEVLKIEIENMFYEKSLQKENLGVKIFFAKPQFIPSLPRLQLVFVNKRFVKTPFIIRKTLREAYGTLLPPSLEPYFILFLDLPPYFFDVNVHPKKEEINILNPTPILKTLKEVVQETFQKQGAAFSPKAQEKKKEYIFTLKEAPEDYKATQRTDELQPVEKLTFLQPEDTPYKKPKDFLQAMNLFLIFEKDNSLVIADQHAAHERVLYEKFMAAFKDSSKTISQPLLLPEVLEPNLSLYQLIKENLDILEKLGFKLEPFGQNLFKITHVPFIILEKNLDSKKILAEVLNDLYLGKRKIPASFEKAVATLACRSAVKAGDELSKEEVQKIIDLLTNSKTPYTCPHGRPTHIIITRRELEKLFRRK